LAYISRCGMTKPVKKYIRFKVFVRPWIRYTFWLILITASWDIGQNNSSFFSPLFYLGVFPSTLMQQAALILLACFAYSGNRVWPGKYKKRLIRWKASNACAKRLFIYKLFLTHNIIQERPWMPLNVCLWTVDKPLLTMRDWERMYDLESKQTLTSHNDRREKGFKYAKRNLLTANLYIRIIYSRDAPCRQTKPKEKNKLRPTSLNSLFPLYDSIRFHPKMRRWTKTAIYVQIPRRIIGVVILSILICYRSFLSLLPRRPFIYNPNWLLDSSFTACELPPTSPSQASNKCDCTVISKRLWIDCESIVNRFIRNCTVISNRLRIDSKAIVNRFQRDCKVIFNRL
jgi:hypothetical protein